MRGYGELNAPPGEEFLLRFHVGHKAWMRAGIAPVTVPRPPLSPDELAILRDRLISPFVKYHPTAGSVHYQNKLQTWPYRTIRHRSCGV